MPLASHVALSIGFFVGILPAVTLVFMTLKDYDEYYEDKHFFYLMVVGFFAGMMTALVYYWSMGYLVQTSSLAVLIVTIVVFAVYEILLITIILSMKRFDGKYDITYYGVVLGGSIAGIIEMFIIYVYLNTYELNVQAVASMILVIPTLIFVYLSMGAMVGFGIHQRKYFKYAGRALLLKVVFNILFILWLWSFWFEPSGYGWEFMSIGLVISFIMYYYTYKDLLPEALPEKLQKHLRRSKRKRRRQ
jgi:hypothetical protein